jgi:trehalose synthase
MDPINPVVRIEDYERYIGARAVDRIAKKAERLKGLHAVNINSTYYGGGVAEMLSSKTLLFNSLGIKTGWRVMQGSPDFFGITKKMHNALQGRAINLTDMKMRIYEDVVCENALRNHLTHDMVIVHDPQPLPMINHYRKRGPWIWRCHLDLSRPDRGLWNYLVKFIRSYDALILSLKEYKQKGTGTPQLFFLPAIDPFTIKNRELDEKDINERLDHYSIPTDLPLVVQISRFDRWKDPGGVIQAFKTARKEIDCTLVLLGNVATDDPEGEQVYESLMKEREERIIIRSVQDTALVNALQRKAAVVLQKSIREGFGLTVAEAMWKGTAVIGGDTGGIRCQIRDGVNGYLVSSVKETAERIVHLLKNEKLREKMGRRGKETVKRHFLLTRLIEEYLDLFGSFETNFKLPKEAVTRICPES